MLSVDLMAEKLVGGNTWDDVMKSSEFFREKGYDSRPLYLHCIDFVSHPPHVMWDHVVAEDNEPDLIPGIVAMLEPVAASAVAFLWLGESFGAAQLVGGAIVLTAILLAQTAR